MKRKKIKTAALMLSASLLFSGCVEHVELNKKAIAEAMAIDYEDGHFSVTVQYFNNSGEGGKTLIDNSQPNVLNVQGTGANVYAAVNDASINCGREIMLGINQIMIIGKEAAKEHLSDIISFATTNYQSHPKVLVAVAGDKAADLLQVKFKEGDVSTQKLSFMFENAARNSYIAEPDFLKIMREVSSSSGSFCIPVLKITGSSQESGSNSQSKENEETPESSSNDEQQGEAENQDSQKQQDEQNNESKTDTDASEDGKSIEISGGALFIDAKYAADVDIRAMSGIQILSGEAEDVPLTFKHDGDVISVSLYSVNTDIKPIMDEKTQQLIFEINVNAKGKYLDKDIKSGAPTISEEINKSAEEQTINRLKSALEATALKYGADAVGLHNIIRHNNYRLWRLVEEDYASYIKNAKYKIDVDINIDRFGLHE